MTNNHNTATKATVRPKTKAPCKPKEIVQSPQVQSNNRRVKVGPFVVLIRNKQHYRLYTVELEGVTVLKQMSYPSIGQIRNGIITAAEEKLLPRVTATQWLKASLKEFNEERLVIAEQNRNTKPRCRPILRDSR